MVNDREIMDKLTGVPETMLLTLYHRALDTQRTDRIINDEFAVRLVEQIEHDFSKFDDWRMQWGIPVRT
jgi:O-methyltransferase involved in polyketide biosynthesis